MPPGRPIGHNTSDLKKLFEKYEEKIVKDGRIVSPKSEIWSHICQTHSINKKSKAIYTAALRWLSKTRKDAESESENQTQNENDVSVETSMECTDKSSSYDESTPPKKNGVKFQIHFSSKQWNTIKPAEISYARKRKGSHKSGIRKYRTLQPGLWTDVFSKEIAKKKDIPCEFIFKNNKCYLTGETFVKIQGQCSICSSVLSGIIKKEPDEDEPATVIVKIHGIKYRRHKNKTAKVKVTAQVAESLYTQKKPATTIRRRLLKQSAQMFRTPTGRIMSANAIRCGQYRQRKKQKIDTCPFTSLTYLKSSNLYKDSIQRINYDPFAVFYATPDQIKLYQAYKKRNPNTRVSCDATGGLTHKLGMICCLQTKKIQNRTNYFFSKTTI